eukprot:TRINITY_DN1859_c0_g1_i2.p1 TRINITY_DN1859_c0_g1~~TRINITY_DN1859_c0_g1_i2.p1  ORF type:complete len:369 (-),score=17.11 TRINITY_DN1859_c0_g1_i2:675-1781(-)
MIEVINTCLTFIALSVFEALLKKVCRSTYSVEMCDLVWENVVLIELKNILRILDPNLICYKLGFCSNFKIVLDPRKDYFKRVLKNSPPPTHPRKALDLNNTYKFLVFADPHVEYDYQEGRNGVCNDASCCRKQNEIATKKEHRAGRYGFLGKCDLPPITLEHFVKTALEKFKPDSFMWLGDNPSHQIWNQNKKNHLDGIRHVTRLILGHPLQEYTTVGKMYPILGNHEGLPCDIFNLEGTTHSWIVNDTAHLWKQWFTGEAYEDYLRIGCYSQLHPGTKLRIVGVNDLVHDTLNSYLWKNSTNPLGVVSCTAIIRQITWLEKTLEKAEENGESVIILTHMPMNGKQTISGIKGYRQEIIQNGVQDTFH